MMKIIALEDMQSRIMWLKAFMDTQGVEFEVTWEKSVDQFLRTLEKEQFDLVLLDHDLGGVPESLTEGTRDWAGKNGMDAAKYMTQVECPVIVWSFNSYRAPQMVEELHARGMNQAAWLPFGSREFVISVTSIVSELNLKFLAEEMGYE